MLKRENIVTSAKDTSFKNAVKKIIFFLEKKNVLDEKKMFTKVVHKRGTNESQQRSQKSARFFRDALLFPGNGLFVEVTRSKVTAKSLFSY
jgi:fatty acid-binding protein DegV